MYRIEMGPFAKITMEMLQPSLNFWFLFTATTGIEIHLIVQWKKKRTIFTQCANH